jgi:uncharacterized membrane protein
MRRLTLSRRTLLTATALGAATAGAGAGHALATPRGGRRFGPVGTTRTTATAADVTAVPLSTSDGLFMWQPTTVNARGDVVGDSTEGTPVVWSDGVLTEAPLPGPGVAYLEDINDHGQFVGGFRRASDSQQFAVAWPDGIGGEAVLIETSPEFRDSRAFFVNNNGQVVFKAINVGEYTHRTFLHDLNDGSRTEILGPPGRPADVYPRGLNDAGQFASSVYVSGEGYSAFFWEDGVATDLTVDGIGTIQHLNESGDVLVDYRPPEGYPQRAYVWRNGTFTDIPPLGENDLSLSYTRQPMNDLGDVVGTSETADWELIPFFSTGGRTTVLSAPAGLSPDPLGLNNTGLIVGRYEYPGTTRWGACLWQNGTFLDLGTVEGFGSCQGMLATERGDVLAFASRGPGGANGTFQLTVN